MAIRMGVLTKYLIRAHLGPFLFALSTITALIFLNSLSQRVGDLVGKGLHWSVIGDFLVLSLPHVIALALPMSVLVAVLYAFNDLASSNEITALSAGGIRPRKMILPVVSLGVLAAAVMFYFNDTVLPESNHALKNLILDIGRKSPTLDFREQVVNEVRPGAGAELYYLTADRIDHETNTLENVTIFDANDQYRQRTTYAASGEMTFNEARTDLYLTLRDGVVHEVQSGREGGFQRLFFESQIIPLRGIGNELERRLGGADRGDREMGFAMLAENARSRKGQLASLREESRQGASLAVRIALNQPVDSAAAEALVGTPTQASRLRSAQSLQDRDRMTQQSVTSARSRAARGVALEQTVSRFEVEIHKKLALAFACIVFTLIGPPLALRFPRSGVGFVVAASSVIFSVYWVGLILGESLAERRVASPAVTMWLSNVIFLIIGLVLLSRMGKTGGATRGGGFGGIRSLLGRSGSQAEPAVGVAK
jgi:lipopolysaccharide export system permease protein